jgi:hypothetical protein
MAEEKHALRWPIVTCADGCGAERRSNPSMLPQGQYRCNDCRNKRPVVPSKTKKYGRIKAAEYRARKRAASGPRRLTCIRCAKEFTLVGVLGNKLTCSDECAKARKIERDRIKRAAYEARNPKRQCGRVYKQHNRRKRRKGRKLWLVRQPQPVIGRSIGRWVAGPCKVCEKHFIGRDKRHVFCSTECRDSVYRNIKSSDESYLQTRAPRKTHRMGNDHRKRARHYGVEYESVDARRVYARDKWRCGLCREKVDKSLKYPHPMSASLDHVVPMSKGGGHTYANSQCAHWKCNVDKGNRGHGEQLALVG